jgi:hypothetical protein
LGFFSDPAVELWQHPKKPIQISYNYFREGLPLYSLNGSTLHRIFLTSCMADVRLRRRPPSASSPSCWPRNTERQFIDRHCYKFAVTGRKMLHRHFHVSPVYPPKADIRLRCNICRKGPIVLQKSLKPER